MRSSSVLFLWESDDNADGRLKIKKGIALGLIKCLVERVKDKVLEEYDLQMINQVEQLVESLKNCIEFGREEVPISVALFFDFNVMDFPGFFFVKPFSHIQTNKMDLKNAIIMGTAKIGGVFHVSDKIPCASSYTYMDFGLELEAKEKSNQRGTDDDNDNDDDEISIMPNVSLGKLRTLDVSDFPKLLKIGLDIMNFLSFNPETMEINDKLIAMGMLVEDEDTGAVLAAGLRLIYKDIDILSSIYAVDWPSAKAVISALMLEELPSVNIPNRTPPMMPAAAAYGLELIMPAFFYIENLMVLQLLHKNPIFKPLFDELKKKDPNFKPLFDEELKKKDPNFKFKPLFEELKMQIPQLEEPAEHKPLYKKKKTGKTLLKAVGIGLLATGTVCAVIALPIFMPATVPMLTTSIGSTAALGAKHLLLH